MSDEDTAGHDASEERLALLVEEALARAQRGEPLDVEATCSEHPEQASALRELLPSLVALEGAARASATGPVMPEYVGPYRVVRVLGRGGMGIVYLAEDEELDRKVALKILPPNLSADPEFLARFRREAHVAARLEHPGIVRVYGVGNDDAHAFFAMQYVDGCSLDRLVRRLSLASSSDNQGSSHLRDLVADVLAEEAGDVAESGARAAWVPLEAARVAAEVASALGFAHAQGVVHRDVKPANILIDRGGQALVADFGLCRLEGGSAATGTSGVVGTLRYMAPEQLDGVASPKSDVYGVGLVLYELLTGSPAFPETHRGALARAVQAGRVLRVRRAVPDVPRDLETIVLKATAHLPDERYASATELAADLGAFLEMRPIRARPPTAAYLVRLAVRRNPLAALLIAVVAAAFGFGAWRYVEDIGEERLLRRRRAYVAEVSAASAALRVGAVTEARRRLDAAPVEEREWEWRHLWTTFDQAIVSCSPTSAALIDVALSPDGSKLAVLSAHEVALVNPADGTVITRTPVEAGARLSYRPHPRSALIVLETRRMLVLDPDTLELQASRPTWHWGDFALVGRELWITGELGVQALDTETGERREVGPNMPIVRGLGRLDDGTGWLVSVDGELWFDNGEDEIIGLPVGNTRVTTASVESGARLVAVALESGSVLVYDLDRRRVLHSLSGHDASVLDVGFLGPTHLVTAGSDNLVRVWDLERGFEVARLSGHARAPVALACDPTRGRAFTVDWTGVLNVWQPRFRGGGGLLGTHDWDVSSAAFSPDSRLAVTASRDGTVRVWDLARMEASRIWTEPEEPATCAWFGPDGAYVTAMDYSGEAWRWRVEDGALLTRKSLSETRIYAAPTRDRSSIVASSANRLLVLDAETLDVQQEISLGEKIASRLLTGEGRRVYVGYTDGAVECLDVDGGSTLWAKPSGEQRVYDLSLDRSGERLAITWGETLAVVLDAETGRPVREYSTDLDGGGGESLLSVSFGAGGERLFSGTTGGTLIVWDVHSGERLAHLNGHRTGAYALVSDGERLLSASGGYAAEVRLWDNLDARSRWNAAKETTQIGSPEAIALHSTLSTLAGRLAWCVAQLSDPEAEQSRAASRLAISIFINAGLTGETALAGGLACLDTGQAERGLEALRRAVELLPEDHPWQAIAARALEDH